MDISLALTQALECRWAW